MVKPRRSEPGVPRYQEISEVLSRRIERGRYKVGTLLPTESELCEEFSVSRYTIQGALRQLTDAGLVRRRQGSGSQVLAQRSQANYVQSMRSLSEVLQYATNTELRIGTIATVRPDAEFQSYLDQEVDEPWLYVEGVRHDLQGGIAVAFSRVFINRAFSGITPDLKHLRGPIYRLIEQRYKIVVEDVEQEIRAEPMGKYEAEQLGASRRTWAVRVVRRYFDSSSRLLQVSHNFHPADRFSYRMHMRREGPSKPE